MKSQKGHHGWAEGLEGQGEVATDETGEFGRGQIPRGLESKVKHWQTELYGPTPPGLAFCV